MLNRIELQEKFNKVLDNANKMSPREWEDSYTEMYNECDMRALLQDCLEEELIERYGQAEFISVLDKVGNIMNEMIAAENGELELTPEQEQLLDDIFHDV